MISLTLLEQAKAMEPQLRAMKDDLHRHPELSFQEVRTTGILKEKLTALGLELIDLGMDTGVVALLRGAHPGKTVALRADIDAIAQQEAAHDGAMSQCDGLMHGCGHDFHTVGLYGTACLLAQRRDQLAGNVVFLFQPAEEVTQGAQAMIDHGLWDKLPAKPDCLFGLHNRPELPAGQIAVMEGPVMSGKSHFVITLHGISGHGGSPHKCTDVIVAGAAVVNALQTVVSRNTDPLESLVCSVLSIHAGTPDNFVPDVLTMTGSIRAHGTAAHRHAEERLRELTLGVSAAYGCTAEVEFHPGVPATVNSPAMTALARKAALALVDEAYVVSPAPDMGSEDFAVFGQDVPAFFYWLGSGFPGQFNPCWHNEHFLTDDDALPLAAALLAQSALVGLE
ncbi:M20 metallopeptidase family protein [Flavonifractor sp. An4]|uniref:M20 metallopeptidase family protein n=1 Tax=Flavonifractor sp. An4 TaxID=1965634 RepID=UPI000B372615|nr:M20 family metallopeptidase [Flavonifractor sp. An4]OUO17265.1 amidohydrolase [Flavonifractor sp. An4]